MKSSDLKKEKFKKGAIASGIAVGAAASTWGAAYAAADVMGDDVETPSNIEPVVEAEEDVDVEYPQGEAPVDDDIFVTTPQPVYTVSASSISVPASAVDVDAVPLVPDPVGETGPEFDHIELLSAEVEPEIIELDGFEPADSIIPAVDQDIVAPDFGDLADICVVSQPDFADMYAACAESGGDVDEMLDLGIDDDMPGLPEPDFSDHTLQ